MSDCGRFGASVIGFVGSVFSPWYHWSGRNDPENHVAINVALYSMAGNRWAMTERGKGELKRNASQFMVGPSSLSYEGGSLLIRFAEVSLPRPPGQFLPKKISGTIRLTPSILNDAPFALDSAQKHHWWPVAPRARIETRIDGQDGPGWEGEGYFDCNWGSEPLENAFARWDWSRGVSSEGAKILYDAEGRDGSRKLLGLEFSQNGQRTAFEPPQRQNLGKGFWGMQRFLRCDPDRKPLLVRTLEDGPFYMRSIAKTVLNGEEITMMHESYNGDRFASTLVKLMLPFRMPRRP